MTRSGKLTRLLERVEDSDSDELSAVHANPIEKSDTSPSSHPGKMAPSKKGRGRSSTSNKIVKTRQRPTRRSNARAAAASASVTVIENLNNENIKSRVEHPGRRLVHPSQSGEDSEDEVMGDEGNSTTPPRARITKPRGRPKMSAMLAEREGNGRGSGSAVKPFTGSTKRGRRTDEKLTQSGDVTISETQTSGDMEVDSEGHDQFENLPSPPRASQYGTGATVSSDTDASGVKLRRRLDDLVTKYEGLELKYRDLREIGIKTAEQNFDVLKEQSEERARTASELISNLKADLATQRSLAKEGEQTKKRLLDTEARVAELTKLLADAKQEAKTLCNKLAQSRSAEVAVTSKVPGSAVKGGAAAARAIATASSDAVQAAQLKEDLYGDLTGLIVRLVRRDPAAQVFDCIQTGRNGTLHFKLEVEKENTGDNYEEAHFTYKPQLDPSRDRDLMDLLPDFLTEEIEFARPHAARFYSRVKRSLVE